MPLEGVQHQKANVKKISSLTFGEVSLWYLAYLTNIVYDPVRRTTIADAKDLGCILLKPSCQPACHQVRRARPSQPLWCRTCKLTKIKAITYVANLTITLLFATIAFKELFFPELPILLAPPGRRWGKFCSKFRLNGEVHHFKMHFLSLQKYRPRFFLTFSLKSWNNKN